MGPIIFFQKLTLKSRIFFGIFCKLKLSFLQWRQDRIKIYFNHWIRRNTESTPCMSTTHGPRLTRFVYWAFEQSGSELFGASLLKYVLFIMYNYLINFRPVLLGAPLQLGALSARLVRLWVNPALQIGWAMGGWLHTWGRFSMSSEHNDWCYFSIIEKLQKMKLF